MSFKTLKRLATDNEITSILPTTFKHKIYSCDFWTLTIASLKRWCIQNVRLWSLADPDSPIGGQLSPHFLSPTLPFPFPPLPFPPSSLHPLPPVYQIPPSSFRFPLPLPPLRSRPLKALNTAKVWGSAVSSPAGSGAEPQRKSNWVHFSVKIASLKRWSTLSARS